MPDAGDVERWGSALAEGGKAASGLTGRVLDAVVKFPAIGATLPPEVTLAAMDVMLGKSDSLFAIDFFPQATANSAVTIYSDGLPLVGAPVERRIRAEASQDPFIITDFQGWRLQYRPPHVHTLGSCVSAPVNHIHLEVTHQQRYNPARYDTLMSLHIGIYRNPNGQRCLVVWNNYWPTICWRPCMPTWNDLYSAVAWALTASAAIAGVYVAGWVVAAIASAGASVLYVPVLIAL